MNITKRNDINLVHKALNQARGRKQFSFQTGEDAYGPGASLDLRGNIPSLKWGNWIYADISCGEAKEKVAPCGCKLCSFTYSHPSQSGGHRGENVFLEPCEKHLKFAPKSL